MKNILELRYSKLRIAVVSNTAWNLLNMRKNVILALQSDGHYVVAVAPVDEYVKGLLSAGIEFSSVPISGSGTNPAKELMSVIRLALKFRKHKVDLVLSYTPKGNLYSALACSALSVPFVPNVSGLGRAFISKSFITWVAQTLYRITFNRAHRVFFQNLDDMDAFICSGLVRPEQSERLPGSGVDLRRFTSTPLVSRCANTPVFLLVARMLWDKGVGEYVEAARSVQTLYPDARFQLLGYLDVDNPSAVPRAQVNTWVAEGVVEYLGATDDVRPFLMEADCVVLPSYREGVPRTLLEAAAIARPVITTDAPGCRDTVIHGETGFLCRPADALDLAEKLLHFVALSPDERQAMGQRGRKFVEQNFDERMVIQQYLDVVQAVAAENSRRDK
jgi:glycosyltransferase involved in cell wall biosynthesis